MPCYRPLNIGNARYKHGFTGAKYARNIVPCGKCIGCLRSRQMQYAFRMEYEALDPRNKMILFCTFTFAPEYLPSDNELSKSTVQHYIRRLKRRFDDKVEIRYFFCGEHGSPLYTERAHYHAILFFSEIVNQEIVAECWPFGRVDIDSPSLGRFGYVAKYSMKQLGDGSERWKQPPFMLLSHGLGFYFLELHGDYCRKHYINSWLNGSGYNVLLPRVFIERLFPPSDKVHNALKYHGSDAQQLYYTKFVGEKYVLDCKRRTSYEARVSIQAAKSGLSVPEFMGIQSLGNGFVYKNKVNAIFNRVRYVFGRY